MEALPATVRERFRVLKGLSGREHAPAVQCQVTPFAHHETIRPFAASARTRQKPCIAGPRANSPVSRGRCEDKQVLSGASGVSVSANGRAFALGCEWLEDTWIWGRHGKRNQQTYQLDRQSCF